MSTGIMPKLKPNQKASSWNEDGVRAMILGAARYPLLTREQEISLGRQVQAAIAVVMELIAAHPSDLRAISGDFDAKGIKTSGRLKPSVRACLPFAEERQSKVLRAGERAIDKFVSHNLRLVMNVAKNYRSKIDQSNSMAYEDLCQEGAAGLVRAAEKFDPSKGYKFSTYCYWWIRQAITRAIANDASAIRLPIHVHENISKLRKLEAQYIQECRAERRPFSRQELACRLCPKASPAEALKKFSLLKQSQLKIASLDIPIGKDFDTTILELIPDEDVDVMEFAQADFLADQVREVLGEMTLSDRERLLLSARLLGGSNRMTLSRLGQVLPGASGQHLSRERVRQIQHGLIRKLKRNPKLRQLSQGL